MISLQTLHEWFPTRKFVEADCKTIECFDRLFHEALAQPECVFLVRITQETLPPVLKELGEGKDLVVICGTQCMCANSAGINWRPVMTKFLASSAQDDGACEICQEVKEDVAIRSCSTCGEQICETCRAAMIKFSDVTGLMCSLCKQKIAQVASYCCPFCKQSDKMGICPCREQP